MRSGSCWSPSGSARGPWRRQWDAIVAGFARLCWPLLAASLVAVVAALLGAMMTWRALLADLGSPLPLRPAAKVFFVGQLGKYIPGAVWPVIAQMEMGRDLGVPRPRSAAAFFLMMPIQLATGLLVTLVTLGWDRFGCAAAPRARAAGAAGAQGDQRARSGSGCVSCKREPLERGLTRRGMLTALGWALAGWISYGVHLYFIVPQDGLLFAIGAFALSWSLGIMSFVVPAGAGVREVVMVGVLSPVMPSGPGHRRGSFIADRHRHRGPDLRGYGGNRSSARLGVIWTTIWGSVVIS